MQKDVTVSKLSKLQKRILTHARRQMLVKAQKIEPRADVTVCIPAPRWLDDALTKALSRIFKVRKIGGGSLAEGRTDCCDVHKWIWFFEEITFAQETIRDAAKEANVNIDRFNTTTLHKLAVPSLMLSNVANEFVYHPWPYYDNGWYFKIDIKNHTSEEIMQQFARMVGEKAVKETGLWVEAQQYPINCTIPELLRDLFDFPVRDGGRIYALAFSPERIGRARYRSAQAALRRACTRLSDRRLIVERAGQARPFAVAFYDRSGIGLTESGIAVADGLIQAADAAAEADLNLALPMAAE